MKILFAPSEGKKSGGDKPPFEKESFIFPRLYEKRLDAIERYNTFIASASDAELSEMFGIKDSAQFIPYKTNLLKQPTMKAIMRYDGVAFDYLDYGSLGQSEQDYIDHNVIIFSNLFGPISAGDQGLPEYKLKQGMKIGDFVPEVFYKQHFAQVLDDFLGDEPFLDLRAGFYDKFYKPSTSYTTLKFVKDGKVVSHWAKAYRGIVLRRLAEEKIASMKDFMQMEIDSLAVKEILHKGIHTEIVYDIINDH